VRIPNTDTDTGDSVRSEYVSSGTVAGHSARVNVDDAEMTTDNRRVVDVVERDLHCTVANSSSWTSHDHSLQPRRRRMLM